ncbi:MAG: YfaZ family outer membrane protein [Gammaproteobacteria bacterium]
MKIRQFVVIVFCAAPAVVSAQEFRMDVRDNAFGARYGTLLDLSETGQYEVSGSALIGNSDRKALGVGFHAVDNAYTVETPVFVGLGGRLLWVDGGLESGTVLAFGANGRVAMPDMDRFAVTAHAYFAPSITSFGRADRFFEIAMRGEYQVLESAWVYAGYRRSDADFEGTPSIALDSGIHLGMRFTF